MPIFALSLMAIMAMVGATVALGMDSRSGNHLQHAADASALGGATAFLRSDSPKADERLKAAKTQAIALATENSEYKLSDFDIDAVTEDAYGQHTKLEIELQFDPVNYFSKFVGDKATAPIRRRAVAGATWGFPLCVLTLESSKTGILVKDQGTLSSENCIVWSNSDNKKSMQFRGGESSARAFCTVGDVERDSRARVAPRPETGCQPLPDPLENFDVPISGVCDTVNVSLVRVGSTSLSPGIYCGGMHIRARNVTLEPGIYIIREGGLKIHASGTVEADGVTFIFQGMIGQIDIKGDSGLNISAPTEGDTAGIAFAELDGLMPVNRRMRVRGQLNVEGVIYMPSYDIEFSKGGGGRTKSPYLQIVSNSVSVTGDGRLAIDFNMEKTDLPMVIKPAREARLLE
ncbi:MAG: Tad domain-containing protein [Henriciella sp.]|uniref:Tad domain-containing protein n=1 Tax=Henriciella sp. TaxID=1968823 RepID=UPI003C74D43E